METFTHVYRIKNKCNETYWNGINFGTIGKIYVNPKLAIKVLASPRMLRFKKAAFVKSKIRNEFDLAVIESRIQDETEIESC